MTLLDGKKISVEIFSELKKEIGGSARKFRLAVIVVGDDAATRQFIGVKKKKAEDIGIEVRIFSFPQTITTNELRKRIAEIVHEKKNTGVIVQLPLPPEINTNYILNAIPPEKDADCLSARSLGNFIVGKSPIDPPLVAAAKKFFETHNIDYVSKYIVVVGAGKLVGTPIILWLLRSGVTFSVVRASTLDISEFTRRADIIITGVGKPHLITENLVKEGVVIIDAGTSESEGKLVGDVDFDSVSPKASFITPVPGGLGPLGVAMLFQNLVTLSKLTHHR